MQISHLPIDGGRVLEFEGSPREMADMVQDLARERIITFGGFELDHRVNRTGIHNGSAAFGFGLYDSDGKRDVGRLTLVDTDTQFDARPTWQLWFDDEAEAKQTLKIMTARAELPKVSSAQVDMSYGHDGETLEEACAQVSSVHGVTAIVLDPEGPGGGAAIVELRGYTDRLIKALTDTDVGWSYPMGEALELIKR